jgi:hypothetical protein
VNCLNCATANSVDTWTCPRYCTTDTLRKCPNCTYIPPKIEFSRGNELPDRVDMSTCPPLAGAVGR